MGRRSWRKTGLLVAVAFAVAVVSWEGHHFYEASSQQHADYSYQPASNPGFRIGAATKTAAPSYQPNCDNPNGHEDADLCAQWAAVQQTGETNRLASLAIRISVFALLFTIIGTGLLVWTFWETRETSRRQLRAYVTVKEKSMFLNPQTGSAAADVYIVNTGQTPAFNTCWAGNIAITTEAELEPRLKHPRYGKHPDGRPVMTTIGAGRDAVAGFESSEAFTVEDFKKAIVGEEVNLFVFGTVWYEDAFGAQRFANFCQMAERLPGPGETVRPEDEGRFFVTTPFHNNSD